MKNWSIDFKYALRSLRKSPMLVLTAVLTLAIGIGATTAIFSVVNTVLLKPLPYENPERLVLLWGEMTTRNVQNFPDSPTYLQRYRDEATLLEDVAGVFSFGQSLTELGSEPEQINVGASTWNFHQLLGVAPHIGRGFEPEDGLFNPEEVPNGAQFPLNTFVPARTVILSHGLWQRRFGGDPNVLGKIVSLNGNEMEIIGVMPPDYALLMPPTAGMATNIDAWTPMRVDLDNSPVNNVFLTLVGRLKPGVTIEQAQSQVDGIVTRIKEENSVLTNAGFKKWVVSYSEDLTATVRTSIWTLLGAAVFVLLIASANVTNLLMVRAAGRSRELAIKSAMGGSRARLVRQLLMESGMLAMLAGLLGIGIAMIGLNLILQTAPDNIARLDSVGVDMAVLAFTLGLAVFTAFLAGLAPAYQGTRVDLSIQLRERTGAEGLAGHGRLRNALVIGEVALSFVLLIGTGLMVRSFYELTNIDPGYNPDNLLTFRVNLPIARFPDPESRSQFVLQLQEDIKAIPGVENASATFPAPLSGTGFNGRYTTEASANDDTEYRQADYRFVIPEYFESMQTRLVMGRFNNLDDEQNARPNVLVDRTLAETAFPNDNPIGKQIWIRLGAPQPVPITIVGVVEHQANESLHESGRETIFLPSKYGGVFGGVNSWMIRTSVPPLSVLPQIKNLVSGMDKDLPVARVSTMADYVDTAMAPTRFAMRLIGAFGISALVLASIGLYAVLAYLVRQRRSEIGVRLSFGAKPAHIFKLFLKQGLLLAFMGLGVGIVAALGLGQSMSSLLVGITAVDPMTYMSIATLFVLVAIAACLFPAWRATRVDPMEVLRYE